MKISREKELTIALLKEKIEKLSGKKVVFEKSEAAVKVDKLVEALEKLSGKKVIFEAPLPGQAQTPAAVAPAAPVAAAPVAGQPAPAVDPGKSAAAKAVAAMAVDPIMAQVAPQLKQVAATTQVKQLATESTLNEEVITLTALLIGLGAIGALSAITAAYTNSRDNAALKAKVLGAIQRDFAKAGVQATPQQIEAELAKRLPVAKAQQAKNVRVRPMQ